MALFVMLNYVQIFAAEQIASNGANKRRVLKEYSIRRGDIVTLDGVQIATSKRTNGSEYKYLRTYPEGELYGHITGYYSLQYGSARIERTYNDRLLGEEGVLTMQDVQDRLFERGAKGDNVRLTINSELQEAARSALGGQRGAVVALVPDTGEIRAMWSNPSFDPGPLASHDPKVSTDHWESLDPTSLTSPLSNLATSRSYPPGSTYKVVTTAAALASGKYQPNDTVPDHLELELPHTTETLTNFSKGACADGVQIDLYNALRVSCDTTYAILGLELPEELIATSEDFGFNERLPLDIESEVSVVPEVPDDQEPLRAYSGIGQGDVAATPLQMALVAAGVANDGEVPTPHLVKEVIDASGAVVEEIEPDPMGEAMSPQDARDITEMMVAVVESGTGTTAQIEGVRVAGKTGTAQNVAGAAPHTWFIAFAPADDPKIAVAVMVENGGTAGSEATGAAVAAPIAREVLEADRSVDGW